MVCSCLGEFTDPKTSKTGFQIALDMFRVAVLRIAGTCLTFVVVVVVDFRFGDECVKLLND